MRNLLYNGHFAIYGVYLLLFSLMIDSNQMITWCIFKLYVQCHAYMLIEIGIHFMPIAPWSTPLSFDKIILFCIALPQIRFRSLGCSHFAHRYNGNYFCFFPATKMSQFARFSCLPMDSAAVRKVDIFGNPWIYAYFSTP